MLCLSCGKDVGENARYCSGCQTTVENTAPPQVTDKPVHYGDAGFWYRFLAHLIDHSIISFISGLIAFFFIFVFGVSLIGAGAVFAGELDESAVGIGLLMSILGILFAMILASILVGWFYYASLESSSLRATIGKLVMGIAVVDSRNQQVSFKRATGRYFTKIISGLIFCIGFLMVGFTKRKQALHDIICDCYVIKTQKLSAERLILTIFLTLVLLFGSNFLMSIGKSSLVPSNNIESFAKYSLSAEDEDIISDASSISDVKIGGELKATLNGQSFNIESIIYNNSIKTLEFKSDNSFISDKSIMVFLFEKNKAESGKLVQVNSSGDFLVPHIHISKKKAGETLPTTDIVATSSDYNLYLKFKEVNEKEVTGEISLSVPKKGLKLAGSFKAEVK